MPTRNKSNVLLTRIVQNPMLIQPESEELFVQSITEMQAHDQYGDALEVHKIQGEDFWDDEDHFVSMLRPYDVQGGVLTIPVKGVLMNRMSITFMDYATGYDYISMAYERGMDDDEVTAIAFDIDSPGGEVAGNFELVESIVARRGEKQVIAYAGDHAYSAAYSVASAANEIVVTRSGGVGSVGVVTAHMDMSKRAEKMGVKVTFIYAGKHKVDRNPFQPLPEDVKDRIQSRIDRIYGEFVGLVASNRGMEESAVRATEALTYDASEAVSVGFADRVGAITELAANEAETEKTIMAIAPKNAPAAGDQSGQFDQAAVDAAANTARTEGVTSERDRINAILASDEGKARPKAAMATAMNTDMSVEQASTFLGQLAVETPEAPTATAPAAPAPAATTPAPTPFASQMTGPEVGAEVGAPKADGPATSDDLLGSYASLTGRDMRPKKAS